MPDDESRAQPPLFGRDVEVRRLFAAVDRAAAGRGGTVLLAGAAGVGKSRLAEEVLAHAARRGFVTLRAAGYPLHADLAYAPVIEALRPYLGGLDAARRAALVAGLPDLGRLFGGLDLPPAPVLGDPALERTRLLDAVAQLVGRIADAHPLLLVVDDLHWVDSASLELLGYVARGLAGRPVLLITAHRGESGGDQPGGDGPGGDGPEVDPRLRTLARSLTRLGLAERITVDELAPDAVVALAGSLIDGPAPAELLDELAARAGGNPLLVTELVRALVGSGALRRSGRIWMLDRDTPAAMPPVVRDLARTGLERLGAGARAVLDRIVVAADAATVGVLQITTGLDRIGLLASLDELRALGLVQERAGEEPVWHPRHPFLAEVAYAELAESTRRALHADVAAAIETARPDDLARLAHHYRRAGSVGRSGRALGVLVAAGEQALAVHADDEAAGHLDAAVAAARLTRPDLLAGLLDQLGTAQHRAGRPAAATAAWRESVARHVEAGAVVAAARLHRRLCQLEWDAGRFTAAAAELDAGCALLGGGQDPDELLALRGTRLQLRARLGDAAAVEQEADALLRDAQRRGSTAVAATLHLARAELATLHGDLGAAVRHGRRALDAAVGGAAGGGAAGGGAAGGGAAEGGAAEAGAAEAGAAGYAAASSAGGAAGGAPATLVGQIHRRLAVAELSRGDLAAARAHNADDLAAAVRTGVPALQASARTSALLIALAADEWTAGVAAADSVLAFGHRVGVLRAVAAALTLRAIFAAGRGRLDDAEADLAQARAEYHAESLADRHIATWLELAEATVALGRGDAVRARRLAASANALAALPTITATLLVHADLALGDAEAALSTAHRLAGMDGPWPAASAAWLEGLVRGAREPVARGVAGLDALGMPLQAARARLDLAELATAAGDRAAAATGAAAALPVFDRFDARPLADRCRRLLRALGERPSAPARAAGPAGLSARELEVVRLIVDGLSTAEVATRLFISPRTVTTHLQHAYAKLGISSRAALVRWVLEPDLRRSERVDT